MKPDSVTQMVQKLHEPYQLDDYVSFLRDMIGKENETGVLAQTGTLFSHVYMITQDRDVRHTYGNGIHDLTPCSLTGMGLLRAESGRGFYHDAMAGAGLNPASTLYVLTPLGRAVAQTLVLMKEVER